MTDSVDINVLHSSRTIYIVRLTGHSDGTGEAAVIKVDKSTLVASNGDEPLALDLKYANWTVVGCPVELFWHHTTNDEIAVFQGTGERDYQEHGGPLRDPRTAGETGDILLTLDGTTADDGDSYDILLHFGLRSGN